MPCVVSVSFLRARACVLSVSREHACGSGEARQASGVGASLSPQARALAFCAGGPQHALRGRKRSAGLDQALCCQSYERGGWGDGQRTHAHTHEHPRIRMHMRTHAHTQHTHACMHAQHNTRFRQTGSNTQTHTHTHTHTAYTCIGSDRRQGHGAEEEKGRAQDGGDGRQTSAGTAGIRADV